MLAAACATAFSPGADASGEVELRVLGYTRWLAGGPAALRIVAYDPRGMRGVANVGVQATLEGDRLRRPLTIARGSTNEQGTLDARVTVPSYLEGSYVLKVSMPNAAPLQSAVHVQKGRRVYLTTDKPLYQPGQTVHVRALALREPSLAPIADVPVTIEIEDARANKVFKKQARTSRFGVASTKFDLASEVNMGEYHLRCVVEDEQAEKSFTVKRYALPKFKIAVKTEKAWYMPGETMKGTLRADYFFGKPVAGAKVGIDLRTFDTSEHDLAHLEGKTGPDGTWAFEYKLPEHFVGRPLDKGKASLAIRASVTDAAAHAEESGSEVAVVSAPVAVEVFPEGGRLIPGLPNQIYVLAIHPDGTPAAGTVRLQLPGLDRSVGTDDTGFAELVYTPRSEVASTNRGAGWEVPTKPVSGTLTATDRQGNTAKQSISLTIAQTEDSVLLRPEKALYRVGDVFRAQVLSTKKNGSVYVDFVRDGQTILTESVEIVNGRGTLSMGLTPDTFGAIQVRAYQILSSADTVRDTRKIFVQPARDLVVEVKADRSSWRPGEDATLRFIVKDKQGTPTLAVLGVDVVDESLFALAERQPGLERVYFLLEKELMEARYEVHGTTLADVIKEDRSRDDEAQRNSRALMAQIPEAGAYDLHMDTFDTKLTQLYQRLARATSAAHAWRSKFGSNPWDGSVERLVEEGLLSATDARDPWGRYLRLRTQDGYCQAYSVGPDGIARNRDDFDMNDYYRMAGPRRMARGDLEMDDGMVLPAATAAPMGGGWAMEKKGDGAPRDRREETRSSGKDQPAAGEAPRIREFFPETLFVAPEIVTDKNGVASMTIPMADSITTWRLSAFASSLNGRMGNGNAALRVFQDFFVDLDVPVSLTQGDVVSMPVAIYNYLPEPQTVSLTLEGGEWCELLDDPKRLVKIGGNEVAGISFRIRAKKPGGHPLTLTAKGTKMSDAVRRTISVMPDGREFSDVRGDRLQQGLKAVVHVPDDAVADASKMLVTLYPGVFSQVVEGLDSILRMPGGCFEQTSSTTYPNVLVTGYLKKMRKATPEIAMKAEGYINAGYQRLLTFEVPGGGFSVFGQAPANPILTAYGLMEFADMAKVHHVDPALISRTKRWLLAQQGKNGEWGAGRQGFYAEGWSNVPNSDLVSTAYITWALLETGERGEGVKRAVEYIRKHASQAKEPYTAALVANALVAYDAKDAVARRAVDTLLALRVDDKDVTYWRTKIATAAYGTGRAGDIETTALAALALLQEGQHPAVANRVIGYLVRSKDAFGTWESTQATVLAMKAFVATVDKAAERSDATVTVTVNGQKAGSIRMNSENFDVYQEVDVSRFVHRGDNAVALSVDGKGSLLYRISTRWYRPWQAAPPPPSDVLGIDVAYDRTTLAKNDVARCDVKVRNLTKRVANMVMVDVGVPPGFDVQSEDLEALVKTRAIEKFSLTGRQVIVYLTKIDAASTFAMSYRLKARYPVRAQAPASQAYEYYNPDRNAQSAPRLVEVK